MIVTPEQRGGPGQLGFLPHGEKNYCFRTHFFVSSQIAETYFGIRNLFEVLNILILFE
jgi:hypothetical protein